MSTGQMGLILLLISLSVLFAATLLVYIFTREENNVWQTSQVPGLPLGLFASTTMILCVSASLHRAVKAIKLKVPAHSSRWRTWGRTRMVDKGGQWTASVSAADGTPLAHTGFDVQAPES